MWHSSASQGLNSVCKQSLVIRSKECRQRLSTVLWHCYTLPALLHIAEGAAISLSCMDGLSVCQSHRRVGLCVLIGVADTHATL